MLHWDKQEANRLISIFKYSFRWRVFLAGAEDVFITSNRVSYSLIPVRLEYCLKVTFFFLLWVSKMSLKRELYLTASPKNLKEADDTKDGFSVWGFGFFLFGLGFFVYYPQKNLSMHLPEEGWEGKNQRTAKIHSLRKDRQNRDVSGALPPRESPCPFSVFKLETHRFSFHTYIKKNLINLYLRREKSVSPETGKVIGINFNSTVPPSLKDWTANIMKLIYTVFKIFYILNTTLFSFIKQEILLKEVVENKKGKRENKKPINRNPLKNTKQT